MAADYCVVLTTCGNPENARAVATRLLDERLAACIQVVPIESYYVWQERMNEDREWLLLVKAKAADYEAVEACIRSAHTYQTPEVLALPVTAGSAAYLSWIDAVTR